MAKHSERNRNRAADGGEKTSGIQRGPQDHAEGQHGAKTRRHIVEQLHSGPPEEPVHDRIVRTHRKAAREGKRRLVEDREQHDEAIAATCTV